MAKKYVEIYYRVHENNEETWCIYNHDMWFDGTSWSSNERIKTDYYAHIPDDALNKHILAALKEEGFIKKYERWYISYEDENTICFETRNGEFMIELERVVRI